MSQPENKPISQQDFENYLEAMEDLLNEVNEEIEALVLSEEPLTKAEVRQFVPPGIRDSKALVRACMDTVAHFLRRELGLRRTGKTEPNACG